MQRIDALPRRDWRPPPGELVHQLLNIFVVRQRRPPAVPRPPVRAWAYPHREGFGEIFVRMALRVPEPKMLDKTPAGRIWPVVARVAFRRRTEQLLPAPAALRLVGVLHGMACLVPENRHALGPGAALDVEHHLLLELHQAGMGKI